ncbi:MAG: hypothetical protein IRZ21_03665 [Thermoleophilaceae bacterium]|nr:hypothetical protein [Thermoleophilaceae bacterium]
MADWATISSLATAGGTLVLAAATFASVRSANRSARLAERSLAIGLRPVLMPSREQDPPEEVMFADEWMVTVERGRAAVTEDGGVIYMAIPLRNVGPGIAVLHGWHLYPERRLSTASHEDPAGFRRLTRHLYVAPGDTGFWQAAIRDPRDELRAPTLRAIGERRPLTVDLLYGDHEGGQRTISRFDLMPGEDGWIPSVSAHWRVDGVDPLPPLPSAAAG